ncbi:hypothetical protein EDD36DRAFT_187829 [Exophiala viscosa]|uniref:Uncharacterized protein n=1 Tax=Exophiala viscosa TaxID=2486360 RepID=A0AAN6IFS0_9EURO|nr:hypothetical protein EDD36DRAFT_187829 [Exophiala viscosa]
MAQSRPLTAVLGFLETSLPHGLAGVLRHECYVPVMAAHCTEGLVGESTDNLLGTDAGQWGHFSLQDLRSGICSALQMTRGIRSGNGES